MRPGARTLQGFADDLLRRAEATQLQAVQAEFGDADKQMHLVDEWLEKARVLRSKEKFSLPEADAQLQRADDLVRQTETLGQSIGVGTVVSYRTLNLCVALEQRDPIDLQMHPRHLMAACLVLARQYTGRRDGVEKSMKLHGDDYIIAKLRHAEHRAFKAITTALPKIC